MVKLTIVQEAVSTGYNKADPNIVIFDIKLPEDQNQILQVIEEISKKVRELTAATITISGS